MPHLWEIDHAYYCSQGNYYAPGNDQPVSRFGSWAEFVSEFGDSDFDYNLLFRWDWQEGEDHDLGPFTGDVYYRNGRLLIFWMGQRKGLYSWSEISVCRADEPAVIEFLRPRWEYVKLLWTGISDAALATT